jgi:hypothetical protein
VGHSGVPVFRAESVEGTGVEYLQPRNAGNTIGNTGVIMLSESWRRISELYHRASDLGPADRARFLDDACRGDDEAVGRCWNIQRGKPATL